MPGFTNGMQAMREEIEQLKTKVHDLREKLVEIRGYL